jgi:8-oxo-dGTP pyrophosphatase MutT (NUDIX family)
MIKRIFNNVPNKSYTVRNKSVQKNKNCLVNCIDIIKGFFEKVFKKFYSVNTKIIWESRSCAVNCIVLIKTDDQYFILLGQRGSGSPDYVGKYNLPSGYMDWNENATEAALREVWEETGVYVPEIKGNVLFNHMDKPWDVNSEPSANRQNISLRFGIVIETNEFPELSTENNEPDEVSDLRWVNIDNLGEYDFAFNHNIVIEEYLKLILK